MAVDFLGPATPDRDGGRVPATACVATPGPQPQTLPDERSRTLTAAVPDRRGRGTRAPRGSLSRALIIDHVLRLLDEKGLAAFSMRALAAELGVGTMALYTHFPSRDELLRCALDHALADCVPPDTDGSWDQQLRAAWTALYRLFTSRPAVLDLLREAVGREEVTDTAADTMDRMLGLLCAAGLQQADAARAYGTLSRYTIGSALRENHLSTCPGALDLLRDRVAEPSENRPHLALLGPMLLDCAEDGSGQYQYGLDLILAGLQGLRPQRPHDRGRGL
jgi:AcrR family transcriptional regulator